MNDIETPRAGDRVAGLPEPIKQVVQAAHDKKAADVVVLDLRDSAAFTDFFVVCSGQHSRQVRAVADAIEERLRQVRLKPAHTEGYEQAEWVLMDFFDFIVHVFTQEKRTFYSLERLWGSAERIEVGNDEPA